jgi:hypothetical protein
VEHARGSRRSGDRDNIERSRLWRHSPGFVADAGSVVDSPTTSVVGAGSFVAGAVGAAASLFAYIVSGVFAIGAVAGITQRYAQSTRHGSAAPPLNFTVMS